MVGAVALGRGDRGNPDIRLSINNPNRAPAVLLGHQKILRRGLKISTRQSGFAPCLHRLTSDNVHSP
jgi:hypothetical protein